MCISAKSSVSTLSDPQETGSMEAEAGCCRHFVLGCMDMRFAVRKRHCLRRKLGVQDFYLSCNAGGAYALYPWAPGEVYDSNNELHLERSHTMNIAREAQGINFRALISSPNAPQTVVLCWHEDCKLMAKLGHKIPDPVYFREVVAFQAMHATEWVTSQLPGIQILNYLLFLDDQNHVQIEEIQIDTVR